MRLDVWFPHRLRATSVEFPDFGRKADPASAGARDFIRACLTHSSVDRPTVADVCRHSYVTATKTAKGDGA